MAELVFFEPAHLCFCNDLEPSEALARVHVGQCVICTVEGCPFNGKKITMKHLGDHEKEHQQLTQTPPSSQPQSALAASP